jgi:hypothetical protein
VLIFFYIIKLILLFIVLRPLRNKYKKSKEYYEKLSRILIFGELAVLVLEGLFDLVISSYLTFNSEITSVSLSLIVTCLVSILCFGVLPISLVWLLKQSQETISQLNTLRVMQISVDRNKESKIYYYLFFVLRRYIFLAISFFMSDTSYFQLQILTFVNLFMMSY